MERAGEPFASESRLSCNCSKGDTMTIDPRTLCEVKKFADCHLIPKSFRASSLTVPLDAKFDSCVGECDEHLHRLYRSLWGHWFKGKAAVGGKRHSAVMSIQTGMVFIPKPKQGTVQNWAAKALALENGKVQFGGFIGTVIDTGKAALSVLNSAFLILHYLKHRHLVGPSFNQARAYLANAETDDLTEADVEAVKKMFVARVDFGQKKRESTDDWRQIYDPDFDAGEGWLDNFPNKCVTYNDGSLIVTVPYSKSARVLVTFTDQPA
jgi:hypothetical protein